MKSKILALLVMSVVLVGCGKDNAGSVANQAPNLNSIVDGQGAVTGQSKEQLLANLKTAIEAKSINEGIKASDSISLFRAKYKAGTALWGFATTFTTVDGKNITRLIKTVSASSISYDEIAGTNNFSSHTYNETSKQALINKALTVSAGRSLQSVQPVNITITNSSGSRTVQGYRIIYLEQVNNANQAMEYVVSAALPLIANPIIADEKKDGGDYIHTTQLNID
jgi:hypothetical protein